MLWQDPVADMKIISVLSHIREADDLGWSEKKALKTNILSNFIL